MSKLRMTNKKTGKSILFERKKVAKPPLNPNHVAKIGLGSNVKIW